MKEDEENTETTKKQSWKIERIPEIFRVIDPDTKEVIVEAYSIEDLNLQLALISAQNSIESAVNTR